MENFGGKMGELDLLPKLQDADLKGKIVLIRMDHNVVKKGKIKDAYRIEATFPTLMHVIAKGGKPVIMTHIGRPRDKKTGEIRISYDEDVSPIVEFLRNKLGLKILVPQFTAYDNKGYIGIDSTINFHLRALKKGTIDAIYLPNTRFFAGEEDKGDLRELFGKQLAAIAEVFVNDAFGSWQPHASTVIPAEYLPSYAGLIMQKEIANLRKIFEPEKPFIAVVAGSKFDTKIGPLRSLIDKVDHLLLGGVIYNAYLAVKYDIEIKGIDAADIEIAREFVELAKKKTGKVLEPQYIVESDTLDGKIENQYRTHKISDLKPGTKLNYILDISPESFKDPLIEERLLSANTIFVNAVMGFTPHFWEGTSALYSLIDQNKNAQKLYGGGDTLQELKNLLPGMYMQCLDNPSYYFFTGGGTILTAIELGSPWKLESIKALLKKN